MFIFDKVQEKLYELWAESRGPYVLLGLLFFSIFIIPPLVHEGFASEVTAEIVFIIILTSGVYYTTRNSTLRCAIVIICFFSLLFRIAYHFHHDSIWIAIADGSFAVTNLSIFSALMIRRFMMKNSQLQVRIIAAVAIYLLFGMIWARLFEIIDIINPDSFSISNSKTRYTFIYFSFVTLVTLGYGDIVPVSLLARSFSILEGIIGQLYVVILISSLVSEFSNRRDL